jgi:hypothetical protein
MTNISPTRMFNYLRLKLLFQQKYIYVGLISSMFILILFRLLIIGRNPSVREQEDVFGFFLLITGFLFSSLAFSTGDKGSQLQDLLLPVSKIEKLWVAFISTIVLYPIVFTVAYYLVASIGEIASAKIHDKSVEIDFFNIHYWNYLKHFIVLQSIFIAGSAYYKQYAFLKTLLFLLACFILISVLNFMFYKFLGGISNENLFETFTRNRFLNHNIEYFFQNYFNMALRFFFWVLFAPLMWLFAYFALKEREV